MKMKLVEKGFIPIKANENTLDGEFNGNQVKLQIITNKTGKVWRLMVIDKRPSNEYNIRLRFNNLISQFKGT